MRSRRRLFLILALAGAVAAFALAGTVLAQTPTPAPSAKPPKTDYREFFLDRLAARLGVDRQKLDDGFRQARNDALDKAVQEGRLTQEQANQLKQRQGLAPGGLKFHGFPRGPKAAPLPGPKAVPLPTGGQLNEALAQALGVTPEELGAQLRAGKTLKQLATEKGKEKEIREAILKLQRQRLDQAVAKGGITQEQANKMYDKLQQSDLLSIYDRLLRSKGQGNREKKAPQPGNKPSLGPAPFGTGSI